MKRGWKPWVGAALLLLAAAPASAEVATVMIDHMAIGFDGTHRVWLSVLDEMGRPLLGQRPEQFSVEEDLVAAPDLEVTPYAHRYRGIELTVIADPNLLIGRADGALTSMLRGLRKRLSRGDHLRVVSAGEGFPSAEIAQDEDGAVIGGRLQSLGTTSPPRILDATFREVRRSSGLPHDRGSIVLILTGSADGGGKAKILDVVAALRDWDRPATISLIMIGESIPAREQDRLRRVVRQSGGGTKSLASTEGLAQAGCDLVDRARGAYLLQFRPADWDAQAGRHDLRVMVRLSGGRPSQELEFDAGEMTIAPWWAAPEPWIGIGALMIAAVTATVLTLRPRCICRVVVESGDERGCTYEILAVPIKIGTMEGNDMILDGPRVSRNHVLLDRRGGGFELLDLNSENGTFVNGHRITRHRLVRGDRIVIGDVALRFEGSR